MTTTSNRLNLVSYHQTWSWLIWVHYWTVDVFSQSRLFDFAPESSFFEYFHVSLWWYHSFFEILSVILFFHIPKNILLSKFSIVHLDSRSHKDTIFKSNEQNSIRLSFSICIDLISLFKLNLFNCIRVLLTNVKSYTLLSDMNRLQEISDFH